MNTAVLQIKGLSKNYGDVQALKDLTLVVEQGSVFGLLGPNGSGKTTTLGILLGVTNPTDGSFSWFDNGNKDENRKRIGALLETPNFYPYLTAVQNLKIVGKIKRLDNIENRIDRVLKIVNLFERKDSEFRTYSLGMRQRLAIASALLNDPEVLVLDEPTNGLDPQGIAEIRQLITEISKQGKTIFLASHQLDEVEKVCTEVAILKKGNLIRQSGINDVIGDSRQIVLKCEDMVKLKDIVLGIGGVSLAHEKDNLLIVDVEEEITAAGINKICFDKGIVLSELKETRKSLEEQFLEITK